jgi:tellurite resistance-related uncharacterized protein
MHNSCFSESQQRRDLEGQICVWKPEVSRVWKPDRRTDAESQQRRDLEGQICVWKPEVSRVWKPDRRTDAESQQRRDLEGQICVWKPEQFHRLFTVSTRGSTTRWRGRRKIGHRPWLAGAMCFASR